MRPNRLTIFGMILTCLIVGQWATFVGPILDHYLSGHSQPTFMQWLEGSLSTAVIVFWLLFCHTFANRGRMAL